MNDLNPKDRPFDHTSHRSVIDLKDNADWHPQPEQTPMYSAPQANWTQGTKVLAVARLGDWHGAFKEIQYPIQMIDALRDVVLSVLWRKIYVMLRAASSDKQVPAGQHWEAFKPAFMALSDDNIKGILRDASIAPAAWASQIARHKAFGAATDTIHMDIEILAGFLQKLNKRWNDDVVVSVNKHMQMTAEQDKWDGVLWQYGK